MIAIGHFCAPRARDSNFHSKSFLFAAIELEVLARALDAAQAMTFHRMTPEMASAKAAFEAIASWRELDCIICGSSKFERLADVDRYGFEYPTGLCVNCGNIQQTRYYTDETLQLFYRDYYREIYGDCEPEDLFLRQSRNSVDLVKFCGDAQSVLEIGCGAGGNLSCFGGKRVGLDFNAEMLAYGRSQGLDLVEGYTVDDSFDLIIISHVLEHIVDPRAFLATAMSMLKPGGQLFIEVPSLENVAAGEYRADLRGYWQNAHVIHFCVPTFERLLAECGLKPIKQDKKIRVLCEQAVPFSIASDPSYTRSLLDKIERKRRTPFMRLRHLKGVLGRNL